MMPKQRGMSQESLTRCFMTEWVGPYLVAVFDFRYKIDDMRFKIGKAGEISKKIVYELAPPQQILNQNSIIFKPKSKQNKKNAPEKSSEALAVNAV
jgi:hypothetical protein